MKITVIGEICNDIFIYGDTPRLCAEAPVPIFVPKNTKINSGMAGNVIENIKSLNPSTIIFGFHQSEEIKKTRIVDDKSNHMFIRVDEGEKNIEKIILNETKIETIANSDIVIVSDYNKGFLSNDDLEVIGKNSKLSILDSKRRITKSIAKNFTFVKLNEIEAMENQLIIGSDNIIVTLGKKGCQYKNKLYETPNPKETIDVSGAGDTFTTSFILKYSETNSIEDSIIFANQMSSIVVSKRGVTVPK